MNFESFKNLLHNFFPGLVVLEKEIFERDIPYFQYFLIISPFEKAATFHLHILTPFTQSSFMTSFVENGIVLLGKSKMCGLRTDRQTDT